MWREQQRYAIECTYCRKQMIEYSHFEPNLPQGWEVIRIGNYDTGLMEYPVCSDVCKHFTKEFFKG